MKAVLKVITIIETLPVPISNFFEHACYEASTRQREATTRSHPSDFVSGASKLSLQATFAASSIDYNEIILAFHHPSHLIVFTAQVRSGTVLSDSFCVDPSRHLEATATTSLPTSPHLLIHQPSPCPPQRLLAPLPPSTPSSLTSHNPSAPAHHPTPHSSRKPNSHSFNPTPSFPPPKQTPKPYPQPAQSSSPAPSSPSAPATPTPSSAITLNYNLSTTTQTCQNSRHRVDRRSQGCIYCYC